LDHKTVPLNWCVSFLSQLHFEAKRKGSCIQ